jgi:ribosomal protein S18 acetylase RimI-like enzyme
MTSTPVSFRQAQAADLERIVQLLADDKLGSTREVFSVPLDPAYVQAFESIAADPHNELIVAVQADAIVGVLQITYIPNLSHRGGWRALIEGVRVAAEARAAGIGRTMFLWAIERARERRCHMVQLTSDKSRPDAIRFYESLGFVASHEGMKLPLAASDQRR